MSAEQHIGQKKSTDLSPAGFSLENILNDDHENIEVPGLKDRTDHRNNSEGWDEEDGHDGPVASGFCVECEGGYFVS